MSTSVILCGVGGQGTVLASKLIASAAMECGLPVKTAETIGMSQRGGSVFSHLRLGEGVACPLMGTGSADLIIAFEPAEAVRQLPFLREGGSVVVSNAPVVPVSAMTSGPRYDIDAVLGYLRSSVENLVEIDAAAAARALARRVLAIYEWGDPGNSVGRSLRDGFLFVQWRLAVLALNPQPGNEEESR